MAKPKSRAGMMRIAGPDLPSERKKQFAHNFDRLLRLTGLKRLEAAGEIGIGYKLVRRLASAGVSRVDERNKENLEKIVAFFALSGVSDLWIANLIPWLLDSEEGKGFVAKFRGQLSRYHGSRVNSANENEREEVTLIRKALLTTPHNNVGTVVPVYLERTRIILDSECSDQFKQLIDDYYEFVILKRSKAV